MKSFESSSKARGTIRRCLALGLVGASLLAPDEAKAYGPIGHQRLTDLAWQTMLATRHFSQIEFESATPPSLTAPPSGASAADWATYLAEISQALDTLPLVRAGIDEPKADSDTCPTQMYPDGSAIMECRLSELRFAPTKNWRQDEGNVCPLDLEHVPGGIYQDFQDVVTYPFAGMNLGRLADLPDDDKGDMAVTFRPALAKGLLLGNVVEGARFANEAIIMGILALPVCGVAIFQGGNCLDDLREIADQANVVDDVVSLLPSVGSYPELFGNPMPPNFHFLHLLSPVGGEYNDIPGLHYEYAGPFGHVGALDLVFSAISDFSGLGIDVDASTGIRRYELTSDETTVPEPSIHRDKPVWEGQTLPHIELNPLDNFAEWGWNNFTADTTTLRYLARPLHALGDVTVPQHVLGTIAWGHRPLESVFEDDWRAIVLQDTHEPLRAYTDDEKLAQLAQTRRILEEGFRWWNWVRAYRAEFPEYGPIPIRQWINAIAVESMNVSPLYLNDDASTIDVINTITNYLDNVPEWLEDAARRAIETINQTIAANDLPLEPIEPPPDQDFSIEEIPNPYRYILPLVRQRGEAASGAELAFLTLVGGEVATPIPDSTVTGCETLGVTSNCPDDAPNPVGDECHPCPEGQVFVGNVLCFSECPDPDMVSYQGRCVNSCPEEAPLLADTGLVPAMECRSVCPLGWITLVNINSGQGLCVPNIPFPLPRPGSDE